MNKLIKGVNAESWRAFRSEATKHGFRAGEFLTHLVEEHVRTEKKGKSWSHILDKTRVLSEREAAKMRKAARVFEEEFDFE